MQKSAMFIGGFDVSLGYILRCTLLLKALCFPLRITPVLIVIHVLFYFALCTRSTYNIMHHLASRRIRSS